VAQAEQPLYAERQRESSRKWGNQNPEKKKANEMGWAKRNRERARYMKRKAARRLQYGLTQERYEALLTLQNGACAICGEKPAPGTILQVDHSHKTEQVRGLLCFRCNRGLGMVEQLDWMSRAYFYLGWPPVYALDEVTNLEA